jgi:hypothetical protein
MSDEPFIPDPPKCGRCSVPILDGELVLRDHGDWLHVHWRYFTASSEKVRQSKVLSLESRRVVETAKGPVEAARRLHLLEIVDGWHRPLGAKPIASRVWPSSFGS